MAVAAAGLSLPLPGPHHPFNQTQRECPLRTDLNKIPCSGAGSFSTFLWSSHQRKMTLGVCQRRLGGREEGSDLVCFRRRLMAQGGGEL